MNLSEKFTTSFIIGPERKNEFYNAWSSFSELNTIPHHTFLFFNPFDYHSHDIFFDIADTRSCQIVKLKEFNSISKCWNLSILLGNTDYTIISNDDVIFQDKDFFEKVYEKHQEGYEVVHTTENWSCFSVSRNLIKNIGWFDENFMHSWEDIDYRFRMFRSDYKDFRFDPFLVKHLRSQAGRNQDFWDQSSDYFFKKWGINNLGIGTFDTKEKRQKLQATGFFRKVNPKELKPTLETPCFHQI